MRSALVFLVASTALLASACGPTCQDSCRRFYDETECDAAPAGLAPEDAIAQCIDICQDALQETGPEVDPNDRRFNPELIVPASESPTLADEREAAAWMDCVWSFSDDECPTALEDQYCARIF